MKTVFLFIALISPGFLFGQCTVYFQNNTGKDFGVTIDQTGTDTLSTGEWMQISTSIYSWQTKAAVFSFHPDTVMLINDTVFFTTSLTNENDTISLKTRFVNNGSNLTSFTVSVPGLIDSWHSDFSFYGGFFSFGSEVMEVKYRKEENPSTLQQEIIFGIQDTSDYHLLEEDFTNPNSINVMTYNVQLMPLVTGNYLERGSLLPSRLSPFQDVVVFEEAFSDSARNYYLHPAMIASGYIYYTTILNDTALPNITTTTNGGVIIYSKWPIELEKEKKYANCSNNSSWDCLASKGVKYAKINKLGKYYHVFGTHMEAGGSSSDIQFRMQQYGELRSFIDSQYISSNEAVIIAGDLNTSPKDGVEFIAIQDSLEPIMPHHYGHYESTFSYADTGYIIDHVWCSANHLLPLESSNLVFTFRSLDSLMWGIFDFSDHRTVNGHYVFPENVSVSFIDTILCFGDTVLMSLGVSDSLDFIWMLNGDDILGETSSSLTLIGSSPAISGDYNARVSNTLMLGGSNDPITKWFYPNGLVSYIQSSNYDVASIYFQDPCGVGVLSNQRSRYIVYPTLNSGLLYVDIGDFEESVKMRIISLLGKEVLCLDINSSRWVHLVGVPSGIYNINLEASGNMEVKKIIIK